MTVSGLLVILLTLAGPLAGTQQQVPGILEGRVVASGDIRPVANAVVEARRSGEDTTLYVTQTGSDGTFALNNVQSGEYRLFVKHPGFVSAEYGQRTLTGRGTPIQIGSSQRVSNLQILLTATAAFHGRVIDGEGRPFVKAYVKALRVTYRNGQRTLTQVQTTITDDLGEYRIFWLTPGQYYVGAAAPNWEALGDPLVFGGGPTTAATSGTGGLRFFGLGANPLALERGAASLAAESARRYSTVYFRNTIDERAAQSIDLVPGANLGGIDFLLAPVKTRNVRGVLVDADSGQPAAAIPGYSNSVWTSPRLDGPTSAANTKGEFDIQIGPGPAILTALTLRGARAGHVTIPAGETDITGIKITVGVGFSLTGQISVENSDSTAVKLAGFRVLLRGNPELLTSRTAQPGVVSETGSFTLANVSAGEYRVDVTPILDLNTAPPAAPEAFVKSIRYGDIDVLNARLRLDAPPETGIGLRIVVSNKWGSAAGTVLDGGSKPSAASTVVVVPEPTHRGRPDLFKSVETDSSGRFEFNRLPPGNYKVFAWEEVEPGIWNDPAFMNRYEDSGKEIRVGEGGNAEIQLAVIPASVK
jgi:hypothetical protein